jgi:DNA-binding winged helix-turn-helix (wHTH) protein
LQEQPFKLLVRLLEQPGALVTREELQTELWGADPQVDADIGLNAAVRKLRAAFRDPAENPTFIETLPKRGYRFIAPVQEDRAEPVPVSHAATPLRASVDGPEVSNHSDVPASAAISALEKPELRTTATAARPEVSASRFFAALPWRNRFVWLCIGLFLVGSAGALIPALFALTRVPSMVQAGVPGIVTIFDPTGKPGRPDGGIGGYDLKSRDDLAFGFDYDHSGKVDHRVFYRPGTGGIWIVVLYRPGAGVASIVKNANGTFCPVYQAQGLAGYDIMSINDRALAFDFHSSGKLDHLVFYRPGTGIARVIRLR